MNEHDIIDQFLAAMRSAGIVPAFKPGQGIEFGPDRDGKPHRFHVEGDGKGSRNGWYVLFADGVPAGQFGSWRTGVVQSWCAKDFKELTSDERRDIEQRMEQAKRERERDQRAREGEAARQANLIWLDAAPVVGDDHPYLQRKGIRSHGLRVTDWPVRNGDGEVFRHIANTLLIPVMDIAGKITSLQAIFPAKDAAFGRDKDFLKDGRKRGCFYMIGVPPQSSGKLVICEGYATGETIHQATGWCVVVAWDAYNLVHVATAMREAMPHVEMVIAADNDQWTTTPVENPGVHFAQRASAEIRARLVVPQFADLDGRPTDFNDLAEREGIDVVQAQLMPPAPALPAPADDGDGSNGGYTFDPQAVDSFTPFPIIDGKGRPKATIENVRELMRRANISVRYNVISKDLEINIPGTSSTVDNAGNVSMNRVISLCETVGFPTKHIEGYMLNVGDENPLNPVASWITSKPWDGRSRLVEFYNTVVTSNDKTLPTGGSLKELLMRKWLISAVAAAFTPEGVVARGVLTFQSKQNLGKTFWAKRLAPKELDVIADGLILNPADKDSVMSCVSNWIVELGEVDATFRKADIAALKGFISKQRDSLRRPYARTESKYPRRTVFFASVNDEQFLHDPTGNTRWWTIAVDHLDNTHTIDVQQLWAEVLTLFRSGETWHLSREELDVLNDHNREHESINPVHERIDKAFDWDSMPTLWTVPMRATEICERAGIERPTKQDVNTAAAYVTQRHGVKRVKKGKDRSTVWMMPPMRREREGGPF